MMASKERADLSGVEHARLEAACQSERQKRLAQQLAFNAEIRKRWAEADHTETLPSPQKNDYASLPAALPRDLEQR
jgi:hypothetical protein